MYSINMWINIEVKVTHSKTHNKQTKRTWKGNLSMFFFVPCHHEQPVMSVLHLSLYIESAARSQYGVDVELMNTWHVEFNKREREVFFYVYILSWVSVLMVLNLQQVCIIFFLPLLSSSNVYLILWYIIKEIKKYC